MVSGKLVQEIPGAHYVMMKGAEQPTFEIPTGSAFVMTIDGTRLKAMSPTDVVMIGPGYDLGLLNISLTPGRKDTAVFSPSGNSISYTTTGTKSLEILYGIETNDNDYEFSIIGSLEEGGTINSALDTSKGRLSVSTKNNAKNITFLFSMVRIDNFGSYEFGNNEGIVLEPNDTMYFNYANWTGNNGSLAVEIDSGSKGTIDESVLLRDDE